MTYPAPEIAAGPPDLRTSVKELRPTIDYALLQMNASDDPYLRIRADTIAAKAVQTFDPSRGAALPTWVSQNLMQLRRERRESGNVIRVPERIQMDSFALAKATAEFADTNGREPNMLELADATNLTPKRIAHVRTHEVPTSSSAAFGDDGVGSLSPSHDQEAMDYVYSEADAVDRGILEMRMNYGGKHPNLMSKIEVASKLGLHPSQVTRRSANLAMRLESMKRDIANL